MNVYSASKPLDFLTFHFVVTQEPYIKSRSRMSNRDPLNLVMSLVLEDVSASIRLRESDGYMNATKLCRDAGKDWYDYIRLDRTTKYLAALRRSPGITGDLVETVTTGSNSQRGTFVHPRVAISLAQWISPEFEVAVTDLVNRYVEGKVTTEESQRMAESIAQCRRGASSSSVSQQQLPWSPTLEDEQEHQRLLAMHGNDRGLYQAQIAENLVKFGKVEKGFADRAQQHAKDFDTFVLFDIVPSDDPYKLEQLFKEEPFIRAHRTTYDSRLHRHTEVVRLSSALTRSDLKRLGRMNQLVIADRTRPNVSSKDVELEQERTKQIEVQEQEKTKQIMEHELTRRMELELEMMKLKLESERCTASVQSQFPVVERPQDDSVGDALKDDNNIYIQYIEEHYELTNEESDRIRRNVVHDTFKSWSNHPERRGKIGKMGDALIKLKTIMQSRGFDLNEEFDANGKLRAKNKRISEDGYSCPAYSFIRVRAE